jgi:drug/metabolite transporter (DMT)-like permease
LVAIVLALASAISYGGSDFAAGLASRSTDVIRVTLIASLAGLAVILVAFPLAASHPPGTAALAWGVVAGLSGTVGALALYIGFRHAAFSVAGPLSAVGAAGFSVLAGLLLGERPSALALTGIVLALPAIVGVSASAARGSQEPIAASDSAAGAGQQPSLASESSTVVDQVRIQAADVADSAAQSEPTPGATTADRPAPGATAADRPASGMAAGRPAAGMAAGRPAAGVAAGRPAAGVTAGRPAAGVAAGRPAAGVTAGLIAGACFALLFIGLNRAGSGSGLWPVAVAQAAEIAVIGPAAALTGNFRLPGARSGWLAAITGAAGALGTILYFFATHDGFLAVTAVLTSLYPAITIVLARTLLGERLTKLRLAGLALAAACVALIAVGGAG